MALKYGLYVYEKVPENAGSFDVITIGETYGYPMEIQDVVTDGQGVERVIYTKEKILYFIKVEDPNWQASHDTIINTAVTDWNTENPTNQIPQSLQVIFTEAEKGIITQQLKDQITALRNAWV